MWCQIKRGDAHSDNPVFYALVTCTSAVDELSNSCSFFGCLGLVVCVRQLWPGMSFRFP